MLNFFLTLKKQAAFAELQNKPIAAAQIRKQELCNI